MQDLFKDLIKNILAEKATPINELDENLLNLLPLIKQVLEEKKADRCLRIAREKYNKPSAYRSGAIVRCRKGDIWSDLKEVETLHKWFNRKGAAGKSKGWVDCNTCKNVNGKVKCKACGRGEGEKRSKYPSCRPTPSACKQPGKGETWGKIK